MTVRKSYEIALNSPAWRMVLGRTAVIQYRAHPSMRPARWTRVTSSWPQPRWLTGGKWREPAMEGHRGPHAIRKTPMKKLPSCRTGTRVTPVVPPWLTAAETRSSWHMPGAGKARRSALDGPVISAKSREVRSVASGPRRSTHHEAPVDASPHGNGRVPATPTSARTSTREGRWVRQRLRSDFRRACAIRLTPIPDSLGAQAARTRSFSA